MLFADKQIGVLLYPCSFPSTPRQLRQQASRDELLQSGTPAASGAGHIRKVSSLLGLRKAVVPGSMGKVFGASKEGANSQHSVQDRPTPYASTSRVAQHDTVIASPIDAQPLTPTSTVAPSISSRDSMEAVGVSAYLRIRPAANRDLDPPSVSNITILSDTEACMAAPSSESANTMPRSSSMSSFNLAGLANALPNPSTVYTFNEVFPDSTDQATLYGKTALPLVANLLGANENGRMENALIFAYGVSGGGKTRAYSL